MLTFYVVTFFLMENLQIIIYSYTNDIVSNKIIHGK